MKVFMLGWEFPPFISGGLGTPCYGLTKAMSKLGMEVTFISPKVNLTAQCGSLEQLSHEEMELFKNVRFQTITSSLKPYVYSQPCVTVGKKERKNLICSQQPAGPAVGALLYEGDMSEQVNSYAQKALKLALESDFDVIHAHDWMTYPAGIATAQATGKPLVVHVHSTEFDRNGLSVNPNVYHIEREGMHRSSKIIAVSNFTKNIILTHYGVAPEKVEVVYNGVESNPNTCSQALPAGGEKTVLFLGRITLQKGPEYFLTAAKKVLDVLGTVKFVMAGDGDMLGRMIELADRLGISRSVCFTHFLRGAEVDKAYRMADLYVMPSVSEPFGIAPLEALRHGVPVLISKQSGISETLFHALKVDFWDTLQIANKIIAVLKRPSLRNMLRENGFAESEKFRWEESAAKVNTIYRKIGISA